MKSKDSGLPIAIASLFGSACVCGGFIVAASTWVGQAATVDDGLAYPLGAALPERGRQK